MTRNELVERYTRRYLNRGMSTSQATMYAEIEADDIIAEAQQAEADDQQEDADE